MYSMKETSFTINNSTCFLQGASHLINEVGSILLYSGGNYDTSEVSYLFLFPFEKIEILASSENPWGELKEQLQLDQSNACDLPLWVGYLSYELGYATEEIFTPSDDNSNYLAYFQKFKITIRFCHSTNTIAVFVINNILLENEQKILQVIVNQDFWNRSYFKPLTPSKIKNIKRKGSDDYKKAIEAIKELILDGEVYQLNLSQEFIFSGSFDPVSIYFALLQKSPNPYSAILNLEQETIVSISPEKFLSLKKGQLETRPIKGTIAAAVLDGKKKLLNSEKNLSELMMIVDLMRNDLSRVSQVGSMKVKELVRCENYHSIYHLFSIIQAVAIPKIHSLEIIKACYPAGSITGCPKIRAMEYIQRFEKRNRHVYTGSIGYFSQNGDFNFNVAIRTLIFKGEELRIQLGGAIVIDSEPENEYEETLDKGLSIFNAIGFNPHE